MPYLAGFVTPQDYGATGNGVTDDSSAINAALSFVWTTNGGGFVLLPPGTYAVANPVIIPPYTFLVGQTEISLNLNTIPTNVAVITALSSWAPASSTGIVEILSKTPGGWSQNTAACGLKNIYINGASNTSTNLNGINMVGPCYDVHLQDVFIDTPPHDGITASGQTESGITPTFPYHQRYDRVTVAYAGLTGFNLVNFTDSTYTNCLAFQNVATGWTLQNCSNSVWAHCRGEWNEYGFSVSGSSGSLTFTGCTTDQNSREGLYINGATPQTTQGGGVIWSGGKFHADANGAVSGHTNAILVTSSTVPVTITGTNVESGENVSTFYPANAITLTSSSNVVVAGSWLQGVTSAWNDTGGNTNIMRSGCFGATGNPNTQTYTALTDLLPAGVNIEGSDLVAQPTALTNTVISSNLNGSASFDNYRLLGNGTQAWGPGTTNRDVQLARTALGVLSLTNPLTSHAAVEIVDGNIVLGGTAALGDNGVGELALTNASTVPSTNPTGGAVLYANGGNLAYRSSAGFAYDLSNNVTTSTATPTTITTTTSIQALATGSVVAANTLAATQVYKVKAWGVFTMTTAQNIIFNMLWGGTAGTSLLNYGNSTVSANQSGSAWSVNFEFVANSTTSISTTGELYLAFFLSTMNQQTTTVTSTGSNTLVLGVSSSAAGTAGASITCSGFYMERVH